MNLKWKKQGMFPVREEEGGSRRPSVERAGPVVWRGAGMLLLGSSGPSKSLGSLVAQSVKNLPAMQGTWVHVLGREDPLEKEMATHSSILAWRIPWMEEPGGLPSIELQESDTT